MAPTRRSVLAATGSVASLGPLGGTVDRAPFGGPQSSDRSVPAAVDGDTNARLGFVGDVMLGRSVNERWSDAVSERSDRKPTGVWGSTLDGLRALDGLVLNLECCVSARGERRPNRIYYFRADPSWALPALRGAGTAFTSLANNHLLDFGPLALADTVAHLREGGIATAGAGRDWTAATRPTVASAGALDVGVLALTDQSRSYRAGPDSSGTAWLPLDAGHGETRRVVWEAVRSLAARDPDLVVASLHWGPNWEVRPSAAQRRFARWLVDRGVDVVHGHSAHVLQGIEVYRGRPILYDLGDYVDDYVVKPDLHNDRSVRVELVVEEGVIDRLRVVPVRIVDERVEPASGEVAAWIRDRIRSLSAAFGTRARRDGWGLVVPLSAE